MTATLSGSDRVPSPSPERRRSRYESVARDRLREAIAVFLAAALLVPLGTPVGTLYLVEPVVIIVAMVQALGAKKPVIHKLAVPFIGLVIYGSVFVLVDSAGEPAALNQLRGLVVATAVTVAIASWRSISYAWFVRAGLAVLLLSCVEVATQSPLIPGAAVGYLSEGQARVLGPFGPGPGATVVMIGLYCAVRARRWPTSVVLLLGILLLASRTHVLGVVAVVVAASTSRTQRFSYRLALVAGGIALSIGIVLVADVNVFVQRSIMISSASASSRTGLWALAVASLQSNWLLGAGPAQPALSVAGTTVHYAHSQYLTPLLHFGLAGLVLAGAALFVLCRTLLTRGHGPLAVGFLVIAIFGEYIVPASSLLAIGSVFVLATVRLPRRDRVDV
jgi:hypothetical protein